MARKIHELIWHCTATPEGREVSVAEITAWHKQRGFKTIGYHKVVHLDGSVSEGRPESMVGAHVEGHNTGTLGYVYVGGMAPGMQGPKDTRTPAQKATMLQLTRAAVAKYGITRVSGHNEYANKACPSFDVRTDPLGDMPTHAATAAPPVAKPPVPAVRAQPEPEPAPRASEGPAPDTVAYVQTRLRELGYSEVGAVDGIAGDQTETAILAFRKNNGLPLTPAIDDALLIALPKALPRVLSPERTGATPKEVRAEVPEVRANWFGKVWSAIAGAGALVWAAVSWLTENFDGIRATVQPVLDVAGDVPIWLYGLIFAAGAGVAWHKMRKGEASGVAAFQSGERR